MNLQKRDQQCFRNLLKIWPWIDFLWFSVHRVFKRPYRVFAIFHSFALLQTARQTYFLGTFFDTFREPYFGMASGWHFHDFCFFLGVCRRRFWLLFGHRFGIDFQRVSRILSKSKTPWRWWRLIGTWGPKNKSTEAKQLTRSANEKLQNCERR